MGARARECVEGLDVCEWERECVEGLDVCEWSESKSESERLRGEEQECIPGLDVCVTERQPQRERERERERAREGGETGVAAVPDVRGRTCKEVLEIPVSCTNICTTTCATCLCGCCTWVCRGGGVLFG